MSEHAIANAKGWLERIRQLVEREDAEEDSARQEIYEAPLSLQVRSGWYSPGQKHHAEPEEYEILLTTGGPALRILGELSSCEPDGDPELQWQDWGTPWTALEITDEERDAVATFARCFYFGEG